MSNLAEVDELKQEVGSIGGIECHGFHHGTFAPKRDEVCCFFLFNSGECCDGGLIQFIQKRPIVLHGSVDKFKIVSFIAEAVCDERIKL